MKLLLSFFLLISSISGFAQKYSVEYNTSQEFLYGPFPYNMVLEVSNFIVTEDSITFNYKTDYGTNYTEMYRPDSILFRISSVVKKYRPGMTFKEYHSENRFKIKSGIQEGSYSTPRNHKDGKYTFGLYDGRMDVNVIVMIDSVGEVKFINKEIRTINWGRERF